MKAKMNNWSAWVKETDPATLYYQYIKLLLDSGFKVVDECHHFFKPYGFTALFLLAESHFAIHTFPEESKTYLELSSCVDKPFERFVAMFEETKEDVK